ncbi:MAG: MaoC family dehydratase [Alphaproteobacteria bacterium]|nr:MaoC family dehydratase [Alphaproteobacteria bacterium]
MPPPTRWFDDIKPGDTADFGDHLMTEEAIIAFARDYDPQPFHIDREAAKSSVFGGIIASGWHTGSVVMRLMVDHYISPGSFMGSPGLDELRWIVPVRPGDRLRVRVTVTETIPSRSKPDRGIVRSVTETFNHKGEMVMSSRGMVMVMRQPGAR